MTATFNLNHLCQPQRARSALQHLCSGFGQHQIGLRATQAQHGDRECIVVRPDQVVIWMVNELTHHCRVVVRCDTASGQATGRQGTPPVPPKKQIEEAAASLLKSQGAGGVGKAKEAAQGLIQKLPSSVTDAAQKVIQSPDAKAQAIEALKSAATTLAPAAQKMLNQPSAAPAQAAETTTNAPSTTSPQGPRPLALQPLNTQPAKNAQPTAIIEAERSDFDLNAGIFIYSGNVRARHPDFYIECE